VRRHQGTRVACLQSPRDSGGAGPSSITNIYLRKGVEEMNGKSVWMCPSRTQAALAADRWKRWQLRAPYSRGLL